MPLFTSGGLDLGLGLKNLVLFTSLAAGGGVGGAEGGAYRSSSDGCN